MTTVLTGNCGVGFAPCHPEDRDRLIELMEGVEDIPEVVMTEGLSWNWRSFPDYLNLLGSRTTDIDFAAQVPHSAVRVYVMGKRGSDHEPPLISDLLQMRAIVAEGVRAGALGVSTSRCLSHRTRAGALAPSVLTEEDELIALARGLRDASAGVFQIIPRTAADEVDPVEEMALLERLLKASGRPLSFSLLHRLERPAQLAVILEHLERIRASGWPIKAQVFPRPVGVLFGLDLSFHPFRFRPSYKEVEALPLEQRARAMRDPGLRARLLSEQPIHANPTFVRISNAIDDLCELNDPPNYEPPAKATMKARAEALGITPAELAYDLLTAGDGRQLLLSPGANFVNHSLDDIRPLLTRDDTIVALGDGGAHYGMICDSSYTTSLLAYWTRDRSRNRIDIVRAVRALSSDPATSVGLMDRGRIARGFKADLNIVDYARLQLEQPFVRNDLPAGGRRIHQNAVGFVATIVSGIPISRHGEATGARPGRLVRGAQLIPEQIAEASQH